MQSKILLKRTLLIVAFAGLALSVGVFFRIQYFNLITGKEVEIKAAPPAANTTIFYEQEQARSGLPLRFKIPSINVDASVEYVGLTPDGAMDVPKERVNVAWFNLGPRPGENGSAVIAGHYGWKEGKAATFDNLYKLRKGDKIYIEDEKGETISFVVRESRRYDPEADASSVFGSSDGKSHLNLVTCEGAWDETQKTYSKRLVVFTDKE